MAATTVDRVLLSRADDDRAALLFEDQRWSYADMVLEGRRRAALFDERADRSRPPHIGVLLDNVPEYLFWLTGAAISGAVIVGINSTYRGEQLEQLIRYTDCQMVVTSAGMRPLIDGLDLGIANEHLLDVESAGYQELLGVEPLRNYPVIAEEDLFLLIFASGSTGLPRAVRCTQGRLTGQSPCTPFRMTRLAIA